MKCKFIKTSGLNAGKNCERLCKDERIPFCLQHLKSQKVKNKLLKAGYKYSLIEEVENKIYDNKMFKNAIENYEKPVESPDFETIIADDYLKREKIEEEIYIENENNNKLEKDSIKILIEKVIEECIGLDKDEKISKLIEETCIDIKENMKYDELSAWVKLCIELFARNC